MQIVRVGPGDLARVQAAAPCFDHPPRVDATSRFLESPDHHLLLGYLDDRPVGMVTGVELTHPDKGTEMFLYELAVLEAYRNRGTGRRLVRALADLAADRGCYGMWVLTEDENVAAVRTYLAAGGAVGERPRMLEWTFDPA